ncbi:MAG: hypothetical protein SGARI_006001 [Bacillariaceae sp.]
MSLLQYREQLEGLNAALWACQQYSKQRSSESSPDMVLSAAEILQQEEEADTSKLKWWNHIKQLSSTCKDLEHEMEAKFFASADSSNDADTGDDQDESSPVEDRGMESGEYEHGENSETQPAERAPKSTKTKVFSGKGAVEKKAVQAKSGNGNSQAPSGTEASMPPRDTVAEQMLNRISSLVESLEDESGSSDSSERPEDDGKESIVSEEEEKIEVDSMDRDLDDLLDRYESFDEDEKSDEWDGEEKHGGEYKNDSDYEESDAEIANVKPVYVGDVKEREAATSLFLGASGSLLAELKQNLPQGDDIIGIVTTLSDEDTAEIMSED